MMLTAAGQFEAIPFVVKYLNLFPWMPRGEINKQSAIASVSAKVARISGAVIPLVSLTFGLPSCLRIAGL